jgi:hypothetical protein
MPDGSYARDPATPEAPGGPRGSGAAPWRALGSPTVLAMSSQLRLRLLPAIVCGLFLASAAFASAADAAPRAQLPDLDQEAPSSVTVSRSAGGRKPAYFLGFGAAVSNVGDGPLLIAGHRASRRTSTMVADQVIRSAGGPSELVPGVGRMRYVVSPDHRHWHYLGFDHYELRQEGGGRLRRDQKTGFCLGDRYSVPRPVLPAASPAPVFTARCGLAQPRRLGVREGISVGFGDYYAGNLEGQYLPLQGLPDGRYTLVHRVNADHRLRELRYDNDAASVLLSLHWQDGMPYVRVLAQCADSARCAAPSAARFGRAPVRPIPRVIVPRVQPRLGARRSVCSAVGCSAPCGCGCC